MLGTMPRSSKPAPEVFRFAVDDWSYDYDLYLDLAARPVMGHCWEWQGIVLRGGLRSPTKRRIERVELDVHPRNFKPEDLGSETKLIGALRGVRKMTMRAFVDVPAAAFQGLLTAAAAGKVRGADLVIAGLSHGHGEVLSFGLVDPDEPLE